jgi:hypothetical protein
LPSLGTFFFFSVALTILTTSYELTKHPELLTDL